MDIEEFRRKRREYMRGWIAKHRESERDRVNAYRLKDVNKYREHQRAYYHENRDKIKAYNLQKGRERRVLYRQTVLEHYGERCACCGETTPQFLAIDHINGGGAHHRATLPSQNIYLWLIRNDFPDGYRLLCHNCNVSLGIYGHCPHGNIKRGDPDQLLTVGPLAAK